MSALPRSIAAMPKAAQRRLGRWVDGLLARGGAAHSGGRPDKAIAAYRAAIVMAPWYSAPYYDLGLVYKYERRWRESLRANLAALERAPGDEGAAWNAGIAATALGDWDTARAMWKRAGIELPAPDHGEPVYDLGSAVVRINPEGGGAETVWARRVCPVRAVIVNVPLPRSGYRFGDLVLHDGAAQGEREAGGRSFPVFNVLQRLVPGRRRTVSAQVTAGCAQDIEALQAEGERRHIPVEDWTGSVRGLCLRCSYGVRHRHKRAARPVAAWDEERSVGIAASRAEAEALLRDWMRAGAGREVREIFAGEAPRPATRRPRHAWWSYEEFSKRHG